ncbi:hypothetical protein EB001_12625 [bacterium]|jgi:hypothetical protein|nr:hypothetical protein [bacterium]
MKNDNDVGVELPFQVQSLIDQMLNKNDNLYIRGNFRSRLGQITKAVDQAIKKYDNELMVTNISKNRK